MKILVVNGSPKGEYSITLQTVRYWEKLHPEHTFDILHAGRKIKSLEKDFTPARKAVENADLLLFSYPVYTFIAPCQLHRFFELLKASGISLQGKWVSQLSTSKHFYDVTAHRYVQENCQDLGMYYVRGLSADMDDLTKKPGQKEAEDFFRYLCWSVEHKIYEPFPEPLPEPARRPVTVPPSEGEKTRDVVIVTDCADDDLQLKSMIDRFRAVCRQKTRVVNLRQVTLKGGCLGCFNCAATGKCIYKDGFDDFLRQQIQTADATVYAFTVKDHSMGALFKTYDDRQFCNGHRTVTMGAPVGYLVSGNYSREFNLRMIVEGRAEVGHNFLAGVASDEVAPDSEIDRLAANLDYALSNAYVPPQNFYGVGGMKIFRDLIWLMQGLMRADHKFYKAHGQYDFPQKKRVQMWLMYLVGGMMSNQKLKAKLGNSMNEGMLMPYKKVLDSLDEKAGKNVE